jgi:hypothetical protein
MSKVLRSSRLRRLIRLKMSRKMSRRCNKLFGSNLRLLSRRKLIDGNP